jgi:hypothetical protein
MAFRIVDRKFPVGLWLHTEAAPPDNEWKVACQQVRTVSDRSRMRMLIVTDGGAPNMLQRTELNVGVFDGKGFKSVALTTQLANPIKRGLARAVTWTNPSFKALGPMQWHEALEHLDLGDDPLIFEEFEALQQQFAAANQTLRIIREAVRTRRAS